MTIFLKNINIPTLIINAKDDTFLGEKCYPIKNAQTNKNLLLEIPNYGGHVGFNTSFLNNLNLWSEKRIHNYITHIIS